MVQKLLQDTDVGFGILRKLFIRPAAGNIAFPAREHFYYRDKAVQFIHRVKIHGHNTAVVFEKDGSVAGKYRKMHIPDDPAYYEKFYFTPGDIGFEPIQTSVGKLGVLVCWDQWYPEAARLMALKGAELLIYPTAIGWESSDDEAEKMRQRQAWMLSMRGHAVANGLPVVAVNRVGHEPDPSNATNGIQFWGSSFVAGPQGELIDEAATDSEAEKIIAIDLTRSEQVRRWWPFLRDRRIDAYQNILKRFDD